MASELSNVSVDDAERQVLERLLAYTVACRDAAARHGLDHQWDRYAHASTVIDEVLANGWAEPDSDAL